MTIAEHVEDESTLHVLEEIGVVYAQGFHLGRPQAIEDDKKNN
jgi:EAL domain-containing protein (putative c-di-GMP-specific phosphodiesterase class I)